VQISAKDVQTNVKSMQLWAWTIAVGVLKLAALAPARVGKWRLSFHQGIKKFQGHEIAEP